MSGSSWLIVDPEAPAGPPHRLGGDSYVQVLRAWTISACLVAACGIVLFGLAAARVLAAATLTTVAAEWVIGLLFFRPTKGALWHAGLMGLLLGLTLPATAPIHVPITGGIVVAVLGRALFRGTGHHLWHPALVGRVVVQLLFSQALALSGSEAVAEWPVLAKGRLLVGDVERARSTSTTAYAGWFHSEPSGSADAWRMTRPVQVLRRFADGRMSTDGKLAYEAMTRDELPPWEDTLWGTVPGGIGETCTLGLLVAGMYLIYRGYLRWQLPSALLATAALAAALLPIEAEGGGYRWFPVFAAEQGRAVGVSYVLYHLTAGQLMLGAFLLAGDMVSSPLRVPGQLLFGAGVGFLTIFMRLYGVLEGESYWSILIMNTLVGVIDRAWKRPVLGLAPVMT
jgi:electron transport complex protein RnfD